MPPLALPMNPPTHTHKSHTTPRDLHPKNNQAAECNTTNSPLQPDLHWNPFLCVCYLHNNCASSSDFCNFLRIPQWDSFSCFHASTYQRNHPPTAHHLHLNVTELALEISRNPNCKFVINRDDSNKWYLTVCPSSKCNIERPDAGTKEYLWYAENTWGQGFQNVQGHFWFRSPPKDLERILVIW